MINKLFKINVLGIENTKILRGIKKPIHHSSLIKCLYIRL